jgi:hypothetical protein
LDRELKTVLTEKLSAAKKVHAEDGNESSYGTDDGIENWKDGQRIPYAEEVF